MTPKTTLAVRATCRSSKLTHSQFVAQKTKDAIVDRLRDRFGARPDVALDDPDAGVAVHLARDHATVYLDVGGGSLHERGWRAAERRGASARDAGGGDAAPVRLGPRAPAGRPHVRGRDDRHRGGGVVAPYGAGAVARALRLRAVGEPRRHRARAGMRELRGEARAAALPEGPPVRASDVDPHAIERARGNAREAGVEIVLERRDVRDLEPLDPPGFVVTNPPYGERLAAEATLFERPGARRLRRLSGHTIAILAADPGHIARDAPRARPLVDPLQRPHRVPATRLHRPLTPERDAPLPETAEHPRGDCEAAGRSTCLPHEVEALDEKEWYSRAFRGDAAQLTVRAVLMGMGLGFLLAFTNVYVGLKAGWGLGVALTACIASFSVWTTLLKLGLARTPMTILENNCMQSTASAGRLRDEHSARHRRSPRCSCCR